MNSYIPRLSTLLLLLSLFLFTLNVFASSKNSKDNGEPKNDRSQPLLPDVKFVLPSALDETSGLIFMNGKCYSHNDSGGDEILFRFDTVNGYIDQKIVVKNGSNYDWEELTMDESYIYVGDFGNNRGEREDLKIYRIAIKDIPKDGDVDVTADIINFRYADQKEFSNRRKHNFDCEAMVAKDGKIFLFTKNRGDEHSKIYELSATPGNHIAQKLDDFDVKCLITAADLSSSGELILLGYTNKEWIPTIWLFNDFEGTDFFGGKAQMFRFPNLKSQTEAVTFVKDDIVFISGERIKSNPQKLFRVNTTELKNSK